MGELTERQARFVDEFLIDLNAKQAAIRAGFAKKQAKQAGYNLLQKPHVQDAITAGKKALSERAGVEAEEVVEELKLLGFSNPLDYIIVQNDGSAVVDLSALTRDKAASIQEIIVDEYMDGKGEDARPVKRIKLKFTDKRAALVDLGRHLGIFTDVNVRVGFRWEDALKDLE